MFAAILIADLGNVTTGRNSNSKLSGNNNEGRIENNSNMKLSCENSQVHVEGNSNCNMKLENTKGKILNSSNCKVDWSNSDVEIDSNSNFNVYNKGEIIKEGLKSACEFFKNSNFRFSGFGTVDCRFERNSNADVSMMQGGRVTAKDNSNLKISGGMQNLTVSGVKNHKITSIREDEGNRFEIVNQEQNWFGSIIGRYNSVAPQQGNLRYELDYVGTATIERDNYSAGEFQWKMTNRGDEIQIAVEAPGSTALELKQVHTNSVLISSMLGNGQRNTLKINGPYSVSVEQPGNIVRIPLAFQSTL